MNGEKITVVIPAYNIAPWISRSLDSLLAQTHTELEIIVVDDGSTDNIKEVLTPYTEAHANIRAVFKENGGVTSARLRGAAEATGDWIAFMDGDDFVEPQMYGQLLALARIYGADIAHCGHQIRFADGRVEYVHKSEEILSLDHQKGLEALLDNRIFSMSLCTKLYRRELFDGLENWMDTSIKNNEDLLMNYYLFDRAQNTVFKGETAYHYILREGSASNRGITERIIFDPIRVRELLLQRCKPEMYDSVKQSMLRNLLFSYGMLTVNRECRPMTEARRQVRTLLQEQKDAFHLLSLRNKVLANMICAAPWTFRIAYSIYVKLFQREQTH